MSQASGMSKGKTVERNVQQYSEDMILTRALEYTTIGGTEEFMSPLMYMYLFNGIPYCEKVITWCLLEDRFNMVPVERKDVMHILLMMGLLSTSCPDRHPAISNNCWKTWDVVRDSYLAMAFTMICAYICHRKVLCDDLHTIYMHLGYDNILHKAGLLKNKILHLSKQDYNVNLAFEIGLELLKRAKAQDSIYYGFYLITVVTTVNKAPGELYQRVRKNTPTAPYFDSHQVCPLIYQNSSSVGESDTVARQLCLVFCTNAFPLMPISNYETDKYVDHWNKTRRKSEIYSHEVFAFMEKRTDDRFCKWMPQFKDKVY